ncbi:YqiA/YcfP family alpha/beta fold hydrolase [Acinetobacter sp. MD2(2019)]|uniref:YqiA/YcfP family alpha/beta fold hydrolase n=1 Tax=Acinetobacter sp. MD2(2019) TaxID=2605273 RepID=UPI002D1F650E|nr:YqiA/YcfP family alpha/beta fold hydrolase [Acinetobacter sp. MD2(2019)]MEB3753432.1 esterase [Acinetobacter sp. MD2(2019)]
MKMNNTKILFFHGLDSSKQSTKFHAIASRQKYCIDVDYRNLNFDTVYAFYRNMIQTIKPDLLVGHGVGGYWALKMSLDYQLPAIVANPSLAPRFRSDYPALQESDLEHDIPQFAYLELADEVLDMHQTLSVLERFMIVHTYAGGYHRLEHPEHLNLLIQHFENTLYSTKK